MVREHRLKMALKPQAKQQYQSPGGAREKTHDHPQVVRQTSPCTFGEDVTKNPHLQCMQIVHQRFN